MSAAAGHPGDGSRRIDQIGATVATVEAGADLLTAILKATADAETVEPVADQQRITVAIWLVVQAIGQAVIVIYAGPLRMAVAAVLHLRVAAIVERIEQRHAGEQDANHVGRTL